MPGPMTQGTFATGSVASTGGVAGDVLTPPTGATSMKLTITGLDGSNTVKSQMRSVPSGPWVDQTTYNSNQASTVVAVATPQEWRLQTVSQQPIKTIQYKLSCES